jgi:hypothetical protein
MNAKIMKTQSVYEMKYDLKGHRRSHKIILEFQNHIFRQYVIFFKSFKTFQECQHYEDTNFS